MDNLDSPILNISRTYATRLARMAFLRARCGDGHLVTSTERSLVQLAKSKLQEEMLEFLPPDKIAEFGTYISKYIRYFAASKLLAYDDISKEEKSLLLADILSEDFKDLVPTIH